MNDKWWLNASLTPSLTDLAFRWGWGHLAHVLLVFGVWCILCQLIEDVSARGVCDVQVVSEGCAVGGGARERVLLVGLLWKIQIKFIGTIKCLAAGKVNHWKLFSCVTYKDLFIYKNLWILSNVNETLSGTSLIIWWSSYRNKFYMKQKSAIYITAIT